MALEPHDRRSAKSMRRSGTLRPAARTADRAPEQNKRAGCLPRKRAAGRLRSAAVDRRRAAAETPLDLAENKTVDLDPLARRPMTGDDPDRALAHSEPLGQQRLKRSVRLALLRRRGDTNLEHAVLPAAELAARRSRHDLHLDAHRPRHGERVYR